MKKIIAVLLMVNMVFALAACGAKEQKTDVVDNNMPVATEQVQNEQGTPTAGRAATVDVDLTALSSTMVYAEVYNMMSDPESYKGRTVKMKGQFAVYEGQDRNYYACIIADAAACCSQGIEFVLDGDYSYPEDYPEVGSNITVEGIFDWYDEPVENGTARYCQLVEASMK